jgi:hypothetical protein
MPAQHHARTVKRKPTTPRPPEPVPGIGGYNYPRGPFGATGFPGSTPASHQTHTQGPDGRKDRQLTTTQVWERDTGAAALDTTPTEVPRPQPSYSEVRFRPGGRTGPSEFIREGGDPRQPYARQMRSTSPERRSTPIIGGAPGSENVRNTIAQRFKARPELWRAYRPSPNPGKTGARMAGPSKFHPGTEIHGDPDGKPIPGMMPQPGPPTVVVQSRFVSHEGSQEGYAMDRPMLFTRGGTPARQPDGAAPHIRGARMDGTRYFGELADQQKIGLPSDSFGIKRARGPNHRPVRFEQPPPWTANYYDVPPHEGETAPDMIHRAPVATRKATVTSRGGGGTPRGRRGRG